MRIHNEHYKEVNPQNTVQNLKNILDKMNISCDEIWNEESSVGTFSVRINIKGTNGIGTNGKGVSKEYALASGYAELLERYQNFALKNLIDLRENLDFKYFYDEKHLSSEELINEYNPIMDVILDHLGKNELEINEKAKVINTLFAIKENEKYVTIPYYSIRNKSIVNVPISMTYPHYGSHGMCAGNSSAEALVQGLCEIFERYVLTKVINEKIVLPDIPQSYIEQHSYIHEMYNKLKSFDDYTFMLKDCSLGGKYLVVALIIIKKNTGEFGINFGSHPDMKIAIERTFTEAAQGQDILKYSSRSKLDFLNKSVYLRNNFLNIFHISKGFFPYQLFGNKPDYEFTPFEETFHKTNKEILDNLISNILDDGYDILIRDNSVLNFPTYHIIIPGLSELVKFDERELKFENTVYVVMDLLKNPSTINADNISYVTSILEHYSTLYIQNKLSAYVSRKDGFIYPYSEYSLDCIYLLLCCYFFKNQIANAKNCSDIIFNMINVENHDKIWINAIRYYLSARQENISHEESIEYLYSFFDKSIIEKLNYIFIEREKIIIKQYLDTGSNDTNNEHEILYKKIMTYLKEKELEKKFDQRNFQL